MKSLFSAVQALADGLRTGFGQAQIVDEATLIRFVASRAAHVAQTALFGYLSTRMGTRSREIFQDPAFQEPLILAQTQVFRACVADLTVFCVGVMHQGGLPVDACADMAHRVQRGALKDQDVDPTPNSAFADRVVETNWSSVTQDERAFADSPEELIRAAPVIDGFKELDREIVTNSIRFRWTDVRRQARDRIDVAAFINSVLPKGAEKDG